MADGTFCPRDLTRFVSSLAFTVHLSSSGLFPCRRATVRHAPIMPPWFRCGLLRMVSVVEDMQMRSSPLSPCITLAGLASTQNSHPNRCFSIQGAYGGEDTAPLPSTFSQKVREIFIVRKNFHRAVCGRGRLDAVKVGAGVQVDRKGWPHRRGAPCRGLIGMLLQVCQRDRQRGEECPNA